MNGTAIMRIANVLTRRDASSGNRRRKARLGQRIALGVELLENRLLLATGFLQGIAFSDLNHDGKLDPGDPHLANAVISVYQGTTVSTGTFLQSQTTGPDGSFSFTNLAGGTYTVQETPPSGYTPTDVQILSTAEPATRIDNHTIQVQVLDPTSADPLKANIDNIVATADTIELYVDAVTTGPYQHPALGSAVAPVTFSAGQVSVSLSGGGLAAPTPEFYTLCVDLFHDIAANSIYNVLPTPASPGLQNGDEVAYLYNRFNTPFGTPLPTIQTAGLQVAEWELVYGNAFHVVSVGAGGADTAAVLAQASAYINSATGQSEDGDFLAGNVPGNTNVPGQGLIVSGSLNFGNTQLPLASPTINTTPNLSVVTLGSSTVTLFDTATLSNGSSPTGTITFTLFHSGISTPLITETVSVSGNGTYTTPSGYTLSTTGPLTGTYQWDASYGGDANNHAVSDNDASDEEVVVSPASPEINTIPTVASGTQVTSSLTLQDTAALSGGYKPTGTITFTLYLGGTLVNTETAHVSGDGSYTTPTGYVLPTTGIVTGTYQWNAVYSGDANNGAVSDNNAANEQSVITAEMISSASGSTPPYLSKLLFFNFDIALLTDPPGIPTTGLQNLEAYVGGLYQAILNRAPDAAGMANFTSLLLAGISRQQVSTMIWDSPEHRAIEVNQFYVSFLSRSAEPEGLATWVNALENGAGEITVEEGILASPEYTADHPVDSAFLTGLYSQVLGRSPDNTGFAIWLQKLQNGMSRAGVADAFLTSAEAQLRFVDGLYVDLLQRPPDNAGASSWSGLLLNGQVSQEAVAVSFLASDEFFGRYAL
jgi:hypothetical protein